MCQIGSGFIYSATHKTKSKHRGKDPGRTGTQQRMHPDGRGNDVKQCLFLCSGQTIINVSPVNNSSPANHIVAFSIVKLFPS